jgi:hypothetical protein
MVSAFASFTGIQTHDKLYVDNGNKACYVSPLDII